jgi:hypothetical protein
MMAGPKPQSGGYAEKLALYEKLEATVSGPDALLAGTSRLEPWFAASHAYAKTLKAKPTKKAPVKQAANKSAKAVARRRKT